jgi:hypothetical protein
MSRRRIKKLSKREHKIEKQLKKGKRPPAELLAELSDVQEQKVTALSKMYAVEVSSTD